MKVVSNSSPIIALDNIDQLSLLNSVFGEVLVPPAVWDEVTAKKPRMPGWIRRLALEQPIAPEVLSATLGPGEREAICLARELSTDLLLLDDLPARRLARALGFKIAGTMGVLLKAKEMGLIPRLRLLLEALVEADFRVSNELFGEVLRMAGE